MSQTTNGAHPAVRRGYSGNGWTHIRRALALWVLCWVGPLCAQQFGTPNWVEPLYNRFELEYAVPQVHKWYEPRHLPETYWQPWFTARENYARQPYARYVERLLEGDDFYDVFGSSIGRGWLVYSWTQAQPEARGSQIFKRPPRDVRNTSEPSTSTVNAYERFFDRLVIASDERGSTAYRLMVGDAIYTRFTPLTFSKPSYNGLRLDLANDRHAATFLLSRPSDPNGPYPNDIGLISSGNGTNSTHLMAGHADIGLGDWARLGLSYVNVHNAHTQLEINNGNPLNGALTVLQNQPLRTLWVRLRDDSPADRVGGAALLAYDIVLSDTSGQSYRGSEIGLLPNVEGGFQRGGALVADGSERIELTYDLSALDYEGLATGALRSARVELDVADDYRIEAASNLQTDGRGSTANPVFLTQARAAGNVRDRSNTGTVAVDYGLPVATEIYGVDWNLPDWRGLSAQGEVALNRRLQRYPNPARERHHQVAKTAAAMYAQVSYRHYPYQAFAEAFSMDHDYSTSYWLSQPDGLLLYEAAIPQVYELVDDDDDLNALPEWVRPYQPTSGEVAWPSYDENGDFLNDHNQNANLIPDYEEPFLRFFSDRPQFLVGLDMNHNGTIDRFENDEWPDYPYRRDHRGLNAYVKAHFGPSAALLVGRQNEYLVAGDGRTRAWYALATWVHNLPGGRLRLYEYAARVRDDIPDDLVQWIQPVDAQGRMREVPDELPAQNTWEQVLYADAQLRLGPGVQTEHRLKWSHYRQRAAADLLDAREGRRRSGFFGLVNRVQWSVPMGLATLQPRAKSEYRDERPYSTRRTRLRALEETLTMLWAQPLLAERVGVSYFPRYGRQRFNTALELGTEVSKLWLLQGQSEEIAEAFWRWTLIAQLSNRVAYEGYQLVTRAGLRLGSWHFASGRRQRSNAIFLTINAGLQ